jgi:hypothetical protein
MAKISPASPASPASPSTGLVVFAKNKAKLSAFYREALALEADG